jgi:EpsI family protein
MRRLAATSIVLWVLAPLLLALSLVRPPNLTSRRAEGLPGAVAGFTRAETFPIDARHHELLGTRDVAWNKYVDAEGNALFVTVVFHEHNWKSLHPPHICIRGSNFDIDEDTTRSLALDDGRQVEVGRMKAAVRNEPGRVLLGLYAFVGRSFVTPSYMRFYRHHFTRALLRRTTPGFLVRVEAFVGRDGIEATEARCTRFLQALLPHAEALIQPR